jgi:hypothetical protein
VDLLEAWKDERVRSELCKKAKLNVRAYFYAYEKFEHVIYANREAAIAIIIAYYSTRLGAKTIFKDLVEQLR